MSVVVAGQSRGEISIAANRKNVNQWGSKQDLQGMLGLSESGIDKIRRSLGFPAEDTVDTTLRFFLPEWLRAWARYSVGGQLNEDGEIDSPDSDSPWLEEKRKWSAKRERTKYETEIGQVIPLPQVRQVFAIVGAHIRRACESITPECRSTVEAGLDEAAEEMVRAFPGDNEGGYSDDSNE